MNKLAYIQTILCLRKYLNKIFGNHYPIEIIKLIVLAIYKRIKIGCGYDFTMILINDQMYSWGKNATGELGLGHTDDKNLPQKIILSNIKSFKSGCGHTIALTFDYQVYVWGWNFFGQLGLGCGDNETIPQKLVLPNVKKIGCSSSHSIVLTVNNEIYVWGNNIDGRLGIGNQEIGRIPQKLLLKDIKKIKCGGEYTFALSKFGQLYGWGQNDLGQLGLGNYNQYNSPQKLTLTNIITMNCGTDHTIALTSNNKIYVWGCNDAGRLGLGDTDNRNFPSELVSGELYNVVSVSCGTCHTVALTKSGSVYVWGRNKRGELGLAVRFVDRAVNHCRTTPQKLSLSNVVSIKCGLIHTIATTIHNKIYVWGCNETGVLGLGDNVDRNTPTELEFDF